MIFARTIVAALFAVAASTQAFAVSENLYGREYNQYKTLVNRELADQSLHTINLVHELAHRNQILVLPARDPSSLAVRSEDVLSHFLVVRSDRSGSNSPQLIYDVKTKADCDHNIGIWSARVTAGRAAASRALTTYNNATGDAKKRAKNNLHTAKESLAAAEEQVEWYTNRKGQLPS
jgi:hypothetical protein